MGAALQATRCWTRSDRDLPGRRHPALAAHRHGGRLHREDHREEHARSPSTQSKTFTTSRDGQERVKIRVYQGESNQADECEMLGEFEFAGFRIGYRGEVKIEVTFEIDTERHRERLGDATWRPGRGRRPPSPSPSGLSEGDIQRSIERTAACSSRAVAQRRTCPRWRSSAPERWRTLPTAARVRPGLRGLPVLRARCRRARRERPALRRVLKERPERRRRSRRVRPLLHRRRLRLRRCRVRRRHPWPRRSPSHRPASGSTCQASAACGSPTIRAR